MTSIKKTRILLLKPLRGRRVLAFFSSFFLSDKTKKPSLKDITRIYVTIGGVLMAPIVIVSDVLMSDANIVYNFYMFYPI
jgi:hypothetical protein